ncbi:MULTISPECIES: DUF1353 domain-containing protein [unclassified Caballeronia]|uniref:DUF1353 domain-containing protein n=1 Tax=unclassified Caballeronia TaxID=2646786 RepID=UPI0020279E0A|nr:MULTISPECIES: DUF1353 domain-containing protein [unclassified Caballeronia]
MSAFVPPNDALDLRTADNSDDGKWILCAPLVYQSDVAGQTFTVPAGFQTDLASVPRLPLVFLLAGDSARKASVVHDWLYTMHPVTRDVADAVLKEASLLTGVPIWRAWLMWAGVRVGGASHWQPNESVAP